MEEDKKRMQKICRGFDERAAAFDPLIEKLAPQYRIMLEALVLSLPFKEDGAITVVDLGCGTGTVAALVKERYPQALITCVDFSEKMIEAAKKKLAGKKGISFFLTDICGFDFPGKYDAVVSSLCLHHLYPEQVKEEFYKKVYEALSGGGVFYIFDVVKGANRYLQGLYSFRWQEYMSLTLSREEIEEVVKRSGDEDRPFTLIQELDWLKAAGFGNREVICKSYSGAVYGGQRLQAER